MSDTDSAVTVVNTGDGSNPTDVTGLPAVMAEIGNPEKAFSSNTEDVQDTASTSSSATEANASVEPVDHIKTGEDLASMPSAVTNEETKHTDDSSTSATVKDVKEVNESGDPAALPNTSTDEELNATASSTMSTATDEHGKTNGPAAMSTTADEHHDTGDLAVLLTTSTVEEPNAAVSSSMSPSPVDKNNEIDDPAVLPTTSTDEEPNAAVSSTMFTASVDDHNETGDSVVLPSISTDKEAKNTGDSDAVSTSSPDDHNETGDPVVHPVVLPTAVTNEESKNPGDSAGVTITSADELNETGPGLDIEATASKDSSGAGSGSDGNVTRPVSPNFLFERADDVVAAAGSSIFNCDSYGVTESPRIPTAAKGKQPASPSAFTSTYIEPASSAENVDNDAEVSLGLVNTNGQPVTEATEPNLFDDWIEYLVYCEQGEHISCQFGTRDKDNNFRIEKEIRVPKKLLCDHSPALKSMLTGPWVEAQTGVLVLDDIYAGDFYRLVQILKAGLSSHDVNLGKEENILSNLFRAYVLADRYLMDKTKTWIAGAILKNMTHTSQSWKYEYARDVRSGLPSAARGGFHFAKLEDLNDVHWLIVDQPAVEMPMNRRGMAGFIASNCPRNLLLQKWAAEELTDDLMFDIGVHLVARMH